MDNPGTWLNFTDSCSSTRWARIQLTRAFRRKRRRSAYNESGYRVSLAHHLSTWLVKNERLTSRKYLVARATAAFAPAHHLLPQTPPRSGDERGGAGFTVPRSGALQKRGSLAASLDALLCEALRPPISSAGQTERRTMASIVEYTRTEYVQDL